MVLAETRVMSKPSYTEAPFDEDGNLLTYPRAWFGEAVVWKPIEPFDASLKLIGAERGRSAAHFIWEDNEGREYPMFLTDMIALLQQNVVEYGWCCNATWTIKKRGSNFGIALDN